MSAPADYITQADVSGRLSNDAFSRLFNRNGTGIDTSFLQQCIDDACSQWVIWTGAALPGDWGANGATIEPAIKRAIARMVLYFAANGFPGEGGGNPYRQAFDDAHKFAADLSRDRDARLVTSAPGRPVPRAAIGNLTTTSGASTSPFSDAANGVTPSGY